MSKKFRIILACLLTLVLLPSLSLAAGEVAEVGGVKYATFGEAVNAAIAGSDKTITVIGEVGNYSFSGKNMTGITVQGSETGKITGTLNVTGSTTTFKDATFKKLSFPQPPRTLRTSPLTTVFSMAQATPKANQLSSSRKLPVSPLMV